MKTDPTTVTFSSIGLRTELADAVAALGYEEPTPVQRETIPLLLEGRDLLGQAATGTGKTAAFALPMLQRIGDETPVAAPDLRRSILVPTRELAMQVAEAIHKYAKGSGLSVLPLYGGAPMHQQIRSLERGAHVVVATPGPRSRSHAPRHAEARRLRDARPRRGRRDARHGLRRRSRRNPEGDTDGHGRPRCSRRRCRRASCRSPSAI